MSWHKTLNKQIAGTSLRRVRSFINSHSNLQRYALAVVRKLGLQPLVRALYAKLASADSSRPEMKRPYGFIPTDISHLSPSARQIYFNLKEAIEHQQKENG